MKKLLLILFCLSVILPNDNCFAQSSIDTLKAEKEPIGQHTIYAEGFGNAYWYSIGYDYTLKLKEKHKLSFNFGVNYLDFFTLAPQISYLYGKKHHL